MVSRLNRRGTGADRTVPQGEDQRNRVLTSLSRVTEKGREDGASREENVFREDVEGVLGESKTQETEGEATSNAEEDPNPADEWTARGEQEACAQEEDEEGDVSDRIKKDGNQKCQKDQTTEKTTGPQFRDPATRYAPGGTWLAQVRDRIQGSATRSLKRGKRKWGVVMGGDGEGNLQYKEENN
ncbi:hypothetical protein NDU88_007251 [Pleurodeles waltl]|uniref:Uncharacterized protein n=1 Tax=Pleurodeles waltl TaxID=8319 RepID=A0AAV7RNX1_PLEWA|nr:hypothetical protein NDU88_007251 [Pleurodeles waltl]